MPWAEIVVDRWVQNMIHQRRKKENEKKEMEVLRTALGWPAPGRRFTVLGDPIE
jgi:hypothetical protein